MLCGGHARILPVIATASRSLAATQSIARVSCKSAHRTTEHQRRQEIGGNTKERSSQ
jgi:hypothetical protein